MAIKFYPSPGQVLLCNFKGLKPPEMHKNRPVVVISPKKKSGAILVAVIPLSTSPPPKIEAFHHCLTIEPPLSDYFNATQMWAKCDMIYTLSGDRMQNFSEEDPITKKKKYANRFVEVEDFKKIQNCVLEYLGLLS